MRRLTNDPRALTRKSPRSAGLLVAAAAVAGLVLAGSATTATTTKPYTANICGAPSYTTDASLPTNSYAESICPEPSSPPVLSGGSAVVYLTLHNEATPQALGSANIGLPTGPSPTTYGAATILSPGTGTVDTSSALVKLRNVNLASDHSLTVRLTLNTPVCVSGTYNWGAAGVVRVKQSNDFSGPPGNDFNLDLSVPSRNSLTATLEGDCKLVFMNQPQDAQAGATITSADFGTVPPAEYVKVAVVPANDTPPYDPITTVSGSATLTPSSNAGAFSGNANVPFSSGVATFSALESSATGTYTVTASSTVTGNVVQSDPFTITDFGAICPAGDTLCEGSAQSGDNKTKASVTATEADGFDADTQLGITMLAGSTIPAGVCSGFTPLGSGAEVDVRPVPGMTEVTLTLDKSLVNSLPENGAAHFQFCFGGKIPTEQPPTTSFPTKDGTLAVFDMGTGLFWGLLPDCPKTPITPCVLSRNKTKAGDFVGVYAVPQPWDQRGFTG